MNRADRKRLARLQAALTSIPFPHDGTGTATSSLRGMVEYQAQMRRVMPLVSEALTAIACRQDEGFAEWGRDPDQVLDDLERVVAVSS